MIAGDTSTIFDVSPFDVTDTGSTLDGNWNCRMIVAKELGGTSLIDRAVTVQTDDNRSFRAYLTPTESTGLIGEYVWSVQVENLTITPEYRKEIQISLDISKQGII